MIDEEREEAKERGHRIREKFEKLFAAGKKSQQQFTKGTEVKK